MDKLTLAESIIALETAAGGQQRVIVSMHQAPSRDIKILPGR